MSHSLAAERVQLCLLPLVTRFLTLVANSYAALREPRGSRAFWPAASPRATRRSAHSSALQRWLDAADESWPAPYSALAAGHTGGCPARGYSRSLPEAHIAGGTLPTSAVYGPLAAPHTAHVPGALRCVAPSWPWCMAPDADTACSPCGQSAPPMSSHSWDRCGGARRYSAGPSGR
jgi:hypothetical protein